MQYTLYLRCKANQALPVHLSATAWVRREAWKGGGGGRGLAAICRWAQCVAPLMALFHVRVRVGSVQIGGVDGRGGMQWGHWDLIAAQKKKKNVHNEKRWTM